MVKLIKHTLAATSEQTTYTGAAKTDTIKLPRDNLLQRILIDIRGDIDLATITAVEDAGQRCLEEVRVELTGGKTGNKTVVTISGVDLYFLNFYDYQHVAQYAFQRHS